jgi:MFS family permease
MTIFRSGIAEFRHNRRFQWIVLLAVFTTPFTATLVTTLAPPYLAQNAVSNFGIALTLSLGNLLAAFTLRFAPRIEHWLGERAAITLLTLLPSLGYVVLAIVSGPLATWAIVTVMYGTADMKNPLMSAYQNRVITGRNRATLLSLVGMFLNLSVAIRAPLYVILATHSLPLAFVTIGTVIAAAALLLRMDRLPLVATINSQAVDQPGSDNDRSGTAAAARLE